MEDEDGKIFQTIVASSSRRLQSNGARFWLAIFFQLCKTTGLDRTENYVFLFVTRGGIYKLALRQSEARRKSRAERNRG